MCCSGEHLLETVIPVFHRSYLEINELALNCVKSKNDVLLVTSVVKCKLPRLSRKLDTDNATRTKRERTVLFA